MVLNNNEKQIVKILQKNIKQKSQFVLCLIPKQYSKEFEIYLKSNKLKRIVEIIIYSYGHEPIPMSKGIGYIDNKNNKQIVVPYKFDNLSKILKYTYKNKQHQFDLNDIYGYLINLSKSLSKYKNNNILKKKLTELIKNIK